MVPTLPVLSANCLITRRGDYSTGCSKFFPLFKIPVFYRVPLLNGQTLHDQPGLLFYRWFKLLFLISKSRFDEVKVCLLHRSLRIESSLVPIVINNTYMEPNIQVRKAYLDLSCLISKFLIAGINHLPCHSANLLLDRHHISTPMPPLYFYRFPSLFPATLTKKVLHCLHRLLFHRFLNSCSPF